MFPDAFWLKAGIAQALPAFLHLRGLPLQEALFKKRFAGSAVQEVHCKKCIAKSALQKVHCKRRTARNVARRTPQLFLPCCPRPGHLLPGDENPGMSRADNGAC
ncbi:MULTISPECIES: hypothetical protein [Achromobacter]|uniref:hypothetical protein n=1 Tax=Achromobacter TaxID=222 RepID=UPI0025C363C9|nr:MULTISPECIES: hypothetical protein [Achromobacter]